MHGLHAQNLVVALLVIEHGGGEVVEDILICQRPVRLHAGVLLADVRPCVVQIPVSIRAR